MKLFFGKKNKLRIAVLAVALVAVFIVVGFSSGYFSFLKNGYSNFFDAEKYRKTQIVLTEEYRIKADSKKFTATSVSTFDASRKVSANIDVVVNNTGEGYELTFTFNHKYRLSGGGLFSASTLQKIGESYTIKESSALSDAVYLSGSDNVLGSSGANGKAMTVKLFSEGVEVSECRLASCDFLRKKCVATYFSDYALPFDEILITDITVTQFAHR